VGAFARDNPINSLAVLPLENLSQDSDQQYFSDGMTDALIEQLSKTTSLRVTSRTSAMRYKESKESLPQIARELNVDGVVEGSVTQSGNHVRISVELIRASTDQHVRANSYERDLSDVLKLQSEVAEAVARQVRAQLGSVAKARPDSRATVDPEAYQAYLKGTYNRSQGNLVTLKQAKGYFEEAIQRDPAFPLAYVGLAGAYLDLGTDRWLPPEEAYRKGSEAIRKALELDNSIGEAHIELGYLEWQYGWNWQDAEKEIRYGVEADPRDVAGHETLAWYLSWCGRRNEALAEVQKIAQLDPVNPYIAIDDAGVYYHQRDYKAVVEAAQKAVIAARNAWSAHYFLAVGYQGLNRLPDALKEYQRAVDLSQRNSDAVAGLAHAYASMGGVAEARKILEEMQRQSSVGYVSPYMVAVIYSGLGDKDRALLNLEKAYQERSPDLAYFLRVDMRMDALRHDSRFQSVLQRVALP
jgi:TolB-like protein/cytochrome c-type biogenesis protein CcmH/NrfG